MKIGVLTFYRVANFGANLQAVSTYRYLQKAGHKVVFLNYISQDSKTRFESSLQAEAHLTFIDETILAQTCELKSSEDIARAIENLKIEAVIIGSDAVVQHHPLITRIKRGRRKPFYISHLVPERMFPNPFWGIGFAEKTPTAMMSVSSQNSSFKHFSNGLKQEMYTVLKEMKYISVRDLWTKDMMSVIDNRITPPVTPDPVFAFNQNAGEFVPSENKIRSKYGLNRPYALLSLHSQSLNYETLEELKCLFAKEGILCVALPMPTGIRFQHPFEKEIPTPLSPIDWYALIKYADAYIGSNMHPIIVSLHNAVPCFSIDNWGATDFWGRKKHDGSSKVEHILKFYGLESNHRNIEKGVCHVSAMDIFAAIKEFPKDRVLEISENQYKRYLQMMEQILNIFNKA